MNIVLFGFTLSPIVLGLGMFAMMLALMVLRIPIAAAMFIPGALGYAMLSGEASLLNLLKGSATARLMLYELSVIPLFLLMGQFATQGGLSRALFGAAAAMVGHVRGGLAMSGILAGGAFGAVCGSSVATAATITQVGYPEMKRHGYSGRLSTASLATGGTLGILIPPSVPLVVYALLTEQSVGQLFAAAMIPGILAMLGYIVVIALVCGNQPDLAPAAQPLSWPNRWKTIVGVWPILSIFLIVFGGIYGGVFSPTEAAGIGAVLTLFAGMLNKELGWNEIRHSFIATAETSAMVFLIFLGADMMNATLALTAMPSKIAEWVTTLQIAPLWIVFAILCIYIVLGCVMDELSMLLLTIPVIFPAVMSLDLWGLAPQAKAVWFGILVLMTVGIGMLAPPVGINVYVVNNLAKDVPMNETYKGVMPFLAWDFVRMLLVLFFPVIALGLVKVFFGLRF